MSECHLGKFSQEAPGSHTSSLRVFLNQGPAPYTCRLKCLTFSRPVKNFISPRQAHVNSLSESVIRLLYKLHQYNITQIQIQIDRQCNVNPNAIYRGMYQNTHIYVIGAFFLENKKHCMQLFNLFIIHKVCKEILRYCLYSKTQQTT